MNIVNNIKTSPSIADLKPGEVFFRTKHAGTWMKLSSINMGNAYNCVSMSSGVVNTTNLDEVLVRTEATLTLNP